MKGEKGFLSGRPGTKKKKPNLMSHVCEIKESASFGSRLLNYQHL